MPPKGGIFVTNESFGLFLFFLPFFLFSFFSFPFGFSFSAWFGAGCHRCLSFILIEFSVSVLVELFDHFSTAGFHCFAGFCSLVFAQFSVPILIKFFHDKRRNFSPSTSLGHLFTKFGFFFFVQFSVTIFVKF